MKSIWNGTLNFGLVSIPVKLYSAVEAKGVNFRMLHDKCKQPLNYKCKEEVDWKNVVKGIEIGENKYKVFSKEEIEKLKSKKSSIIEILKFVDFSQIDPIYFNDHYYLVPSKEKEKAYFLLKTILQTTAKVAIGRFILREKEHICLIKPYKTGMILNTLNYENEIRSISKIEELKEIPKLKKEEIELGTKIVNQMYEEELEMKEFKDTFSEKLLQAIKHKPIKIIEKSSKEIFHPNLVEALKASIK